MTAAANGYSQYVPSPSVFDPRLPTIILPMASAKRSTLRTGNHSSGSLCGLERPVAPAKRSHSAWSLNSERNKPLPPRPHEICDDRSSVYSIEILGLIDLYLGQEPISYNLLAESPRGQLSISQEHASNIPNALGTGKSLPELVSRDIYPINTGRQPYDKVTEFGVARYRHSNPSPQSPSTSSNDRHRETWTNDAARPYRDTLLPDPFTPVSVKSPGLFSETLPLRGPRPTTPKHTVMSTAILESPQPHVLSPGSAPPLALMFPDTTSRASTTSSLDSATREQQATDMKTQLDGFSWPRKPSEPVSDSSSLHAPFSYTNSLASSASEIQIPIGARPPPAPYGSQQDYRGEISSQVYSVSPLSDMSRLDLSGKPSPQHWSPMLKPSNPDVVSVSKQERSPAVPLSAYQKLGPKAWEEEDQKELERGRKEKKGLFHRRKDNKSFEPEPLRISSSQKPQRPARPLESPDIFLPVTAYIPKVVSPSVVNSAPSGARTNSSSFGVSIAETAEPLRSTPRGSYGSGRTTSWLPSKRNRPGTDSWREDVKKSIQLVSSRDSLGISGASTLLEDLDMSFERSYMADPSIYESVMAAPSAYGQSSSPDDTKSPGGWL